MLVNRRSSTLSGLPLSGPLHWASVYIAREHRSRDLKTGEWRCPCHTCRRVLKELSRGAMPDELKRIKGGAR